MRPDNVHVFAGSGPSRLAYPHSCVLLLGGLPGVGKSTLIGRLLKERANLCMDDYRARMGGLDAVYERMFEALSQDAEHLLAGKAGPLVIDATALRENYRLDYVRLALTANVPIHLLLLDGDRALIEAGQASRERQVPEQAVEKYLVRWRQLMDLVESGEILAEGFDSCTVMDRPAVNALAAIEFGAAA
jgi:predicted kinase